MTQELEPDVRTMMIERMTEIFREATGLRPALTAPEAAEAAGTDVEVLAKVWRAFGLVEIDRSAARAYDDLDVDMFRAVQTLLDVGVPLDDIIAVARVYAQAFSRIAEAEQRVYRKQFIDPIMKSSDPLASLEALRPISGFMFTVLDAPIRNAHRRQMDIAIRQLVVSASGGGTEPCAVGFVDLVGYSALTASLDAADLTDLVSRFDELAIAGCLDAGARVVKLVGDAVLFVSPSPGVVLNAARAIVAAVERDPRLPSGRAGVDFGDVVPLEGDYFGHPVNVAARAIGVAGPGTVVGSRPFAAAVGLGADARSLGEQDLKGVGRIELLEL